MPAGAVDPNEASADAANRELQEECGYKSKRLDFLGTISPLARHSNWKIDVFLGRELIRSELEGDESYEIEYERVPFSQVDEIILAGKIYDSNVIAALYLAKIFLAQEA